MFELKIYKKDSANYKHKDDKEKPVHYPNPLEDPIPEPVNDIDEEYSFVLLYELNVGESKLWMSSILEKEDLVSYYRNNHDQVKIDSKGNVSMCYVTTLKVVEDAFASHEADRKKKIHKHKVMRCKVRGAIF